MRPRTKTWRWRRWFVEIDLRQIPRPSFIHHTEGGDNTLIFFLEAKGADHIALLEIDLNWRKR